MRADSQDAPVRALLRETVPPTPIETVNWHALHQRIMADAAAYHGPGSSITTASLTASAWWDFAERWAGVAVPMGMAAGLVAALALARIGTGADVRLSMVAAIRGELPVSTVTDELVGPYTEGWFASGATGE
jgi:hypothetical protein